MLYCRTGTYFHYKVPLCYLKLSNHKSTHSSRLWWIASWCSSHTWIRRLIWIRHPGWPGLQCRMPHLLTNVIPNKNIPPILTSHATSGIARLERNRVQEFQPTQGSSRLPHSNGPICRARLAHYIAMPLHATLCKSLRSRFS